MRTYKDTSESRECLGNAGNVWERTGTPGKYGGCLGKYGGCLGKHGVCLGDTSESRSAWEMPGAHGEDVGRTGSMGMPGDVREAWERPGSMGTYGSARHEATIITTTTME